MKIMKEIDCLETKLNFYQNKYKEYKEIAESKYKDNYNNLNDLKETKLFRSAHIKIEELKYKLKLLKQTAFIMYIKTHTHHFIKDYTMLCEIFLNGWGDWVLRFYKDCKEYLFFWTRYKENREIIIKERKSIIKER